MKKKDFRNKANSEYEKPVLRKLTPEQAKLTLFGHAMQNDQGEKDLIEILLAEATPLKDN